MVLGKLDIHMQKNEIEPLSYTIHKNQLKTYKDLNVRPETIKLLEENIGKKLLYICLGNDFLDMHDTKAQATKAEINKCGNIKLKTSTQQRKQSTK